MREVDDLHISSSCEWLVRPNPPLMLEARSPKLVACHSVYPTARLFTSNASRRPSPMKLAASTARLIAAPGANQSQGCVASVAGLRASLRIDPQLGVGWVTPRPRKLRPASVRIAPAIPSEPATVSGP